MTAINCQLVERTIRLWDGNSYCAECLASRCPQLLEAETNSHEFSESSPNMLFAALVWASAVVAVASCVMCGVSFAVIGDLWSSILIVGAACVLMTAMVVPTIIRTLTDAGSVVSVEDGMLRISRGIGGYPHEVPLSQCAWRCGRAFRDSHLGAVAAVHTNEVIVITYRHATKFGWKKRFRVACGWTPETLSLWREFLTLAKVPEG